MPVTKISHIEQNNHLIINVYGYQDKEIFPLYISDRDVNDECINLLLIREDNQQHYCLIRDMSRLLESLTKHEHKIFYCERCLPRFYRERLLEEHLPICKLYSPQVIQVPQPEDATLSLKNISYHLTIPYIIYANFEAIIQDLPTVQPSQTQSITMNAAIHQACGYAYVIVGPDGKSYKPINVYRGGDAIDHF